MTVTPVSMPSVMTYEAVHDADDTVADASDITMILLLLFLRAVFLTQSTNKAFCAKKLSSSRYASDYPSSPQKNSLSCHEKTHSKQDGAQRFALMGEKQRRE